MSLAQLARIAWRGAQPVTRGDVVRPSFDPVAALDAAQPLPPEASTAERRGAMPLPTSRTQPPESRPAVSPARPAAPAVPPMIANPAEPPQRSEPLAPIAPAPVAGPVLMVPATAAPLSASVTRPIPPSVATPVAEQVVVMPPVAVESAAAPLATTLPATATPQPQTALAGATPTRPQRLAQQVTLATSAPVFGAPRQDASETPPAEIHIDRVEVVMAPQAARPSKPVPQPQPQAAPPDRGFARYAAMRSARDRRGW